jgi:hypothetical protein
VDSPRRILLQAREWSSLADDPRSAIHLKEITEDNIKLRESGQVQEKWFDIEADELCSMRKDTKLVVDIPEESMRRARATST